MSAPARDDRRFYVFGIKVLGQMSALIAVPAVLAAVVGTRLDDRLHTAPYGLVCSLAVAFVASAFAVWRKAHRLGKDYQNLVTAKGAPPNQPL